MDKAVWWLEFLIRHRGGNPFYPKVHDLAWYEYFLLDVLAFVSLVILLTCYLTYKLVCCLCCRKKSSPSKKKND